MTPKAFRAVGAALFFAASVLGAQTPSPTVPAAPALPLTLQQAVTRALAANPSLQEDPREAGAAQMLAPRPGLRSL